MLEKPKFGKPKRAEFIRDPDNPNRRIRKEEKENKLSRLYRFLSGAGDKDRQKIESKNGKNNGITRRNFLKVLGLGGVAVAGKDLVGNAKYVYDSINYGEKEPEKAVENSEIKIPRIDLGISSEEKEEIEQLILHTSDEDKKAAKEVIGEFNLEKHITLDGETRDAIKNYWYARYKNNPELRNSLEYAYKAMQPFVPELRQIFRTEFADPIKTGKIDEKKCEDLICLAIPESHWNWKEDSPKNARGPYQIMSSMGKKFKMRIDSDVKIGTSNDKIRDERLDVKKSAQVAARILRINFENAGDLDLAVSWYNAGFIGVYVRRCHDRNKGKKEGEKEKTTYLGFLKFMEERISGLKDWLKKNEWYHYVSENEGLGKVAEKYGVDPEKIARYNKLKKHYHPKKKDKTGQYVLYYKQMLKIPITDFDVKKKIYDNVIGGFIENLNYPGKYNAVMDIIKEKEAEAKARQKLEHLQTAKK